MVERSQRDAKCRSTVGVLLLASISILLSLYYITEADFTRYNINEVLTPFRNIQHLSELRGYLVHGLKCRIQDVDPYDSEIQSYIKTVSGVQCSHSKLLTSIVKKTNYSILQVNPAATRSYSPNGVTCCYRVVKRTLDEKKPDDSISFSDCHSFNSSVNITDEFIIVKCATKHRKKEVYKNAHAIVQVREEVRTRLDNAAKNRTKSSGRDSTRPLSILLIGVDSVSRLNSLRTMPKTRSYLNSLGWTELKGYNKIADNTYPNLMALLTGMEGDSAYNACMPTIPKHLDNCSFIWRTFHKHGYVTSYGEDEANISTFNFLKVGFSEQPTDYYLRPLIIAAQKELRTVERHSLKYCVGPVQAGERILQYSLDFASTFVNDTSFGLFWTNSFSHNDVNSPSAMDQVLKRYFRNLHRSGVTNSSLILFFSDHGMRFGDMRQTKMGWFEERLPFAWISIPEWWAKKHPEESEALSINSRRLVTPYDLHMTLQHILELGSGRAQVQSTGCTQCHSIFRPISVDRGCEDAAISPHWCVCTEFRPVDPTSSVVKSAAQFLVRKIYSFIKEKGGEKKCARLSLSRIIIAQTGISWNGNSTYYLLLVEAIPGRGRFEATISAAANETDGFKLYGSVSRLDWYGRQSKCISDSYLKKYCYCR